VFVVIFACICESCVESLDWGCGFCGLFLLVLWEMFGLGLWVLRVLWSGDCPLWVSLRGPCDGGMRGEFPQSHFPTTILTAVAGFCTTLPASLSSLVAWGPVER
jgi:hypothetical protein